MENEVLSLEGYLELFDKHKAEFDKELGKLSQTSIQEYRTLLDELKCSNSSKDKTTDKGRALENIVSFLVNKTGLFDVYRNVKTSSNEIDQVVLLNKKGLFLQKQGLLHMPIDGFLGECKNYGTKVAATWVGKFCSLMMVTNHTFGILFSYHGMSGRGWNDAIGLTKKIYMLKEHKEDKIIMIDFSLREFEQIIEGKTFFDIINFKIQSLQHDTDILKYIVSEHPGEKLLKT